MNCDFDTADHHCPRCGFRGRPGLQKQCKKSPEFTTPCVHRSPGELRRQWCPSCCGHTQIKIFGCELFGECSNSEQLPGLKRCFSCKDYVGVAP
ncbi:MAG: hypothetical protein WD063_02780 [Pirellulales bacterium]